MTMATPDVALVVNTDTGKVTEVPADSIGCKMCGHLACVCGIRTQHPDPACKFRVSTTCAVPIECDHGYDVCPQCDPCTCNSTKEDLCG